MEKKMKKNHSSDLVTTSRSQKSLTLNGRIPKPFTAYYFTICTLHPVSCSASVYSVKCFVCA